MKRTSTSIDQDFDNSFDKHVDRLGEHRERVAAALEVLPAWFVGRMMDDCWALGLMLTTGVVLGISTITAVTQDAAGHLWLDCEMLADDPGQAAGIKLLTAPCPERKRVSVNAAHVVAAFEVAFT